ncbi:hypothetical protein [Actinomadura rupiterrae]|uniref:hypothetical protein n=1 Tax=Actinomadura rupiterrae TaxID=559627 RepID=UPI0020A4ADB6|nr:hypothetical protein [Actinomadura rupiterrae]MCP2339196.1 hypothetical protein [Actinomadura rupiterrae]
MTETPMARQWREHLHAGRWRRARMTHDPHLPGLYWPPRLTDRPTALETRDAT